MRLEKGSTRDVIICERERLVAKTPNHETSVICNEREYHWSQVLPTDVINPVTAKNGDSIICSLADDLPINKNNWTNLLARHKKLQLLMLVAAHTVDDYQNFDTLNGNVVLRDFGGFCEIEHYCKGDPLLNEYPSADTWPEKYHRPTDFGFFIEKEIEFVRECLCLIKEEIALK